MKIVLGKKLPAATTFFYLFGALLVIFHFNRYAAQVIWRIRRGSLKITAR